MVDLPVNILLLIAMRNSHHNHMIVKTYFVVLYVFGLGPLPKMLLSSSSVNVNEKF